MTNEDILAAFVRPAAFPADAIAAACERRKEMAPLLAAEIEDAARGKRAHINGFYYLTDIACHLLAEWRDTRGFKPLLSLLASPHHEMLGDSLTESCAAMLARMYDGDLAALKALFNDRAADDFARDAALRTYVMLTYEGRVAREDAHALLLAFFASEPHRENFVWNGWVNAAAELQFEDLVPRARQLFDEAAIDESWMDFEDFQSMFGELRETPYRPAELAYRSPIDEMRRWQYGVADEARELDDGEIDERVLSILDDVPVFNRYRDVGRNDPCPCGSGKKFKKCCLPKVEAGLP